MSLQLTPRISSVTFNSPMRSTTSLASESDPMNRSINYDDNDPLLEHQSRLYRQARGMDRRSTLRQSANKVLRIGDIEGHHGNRLYNIITDFIIFVLTTVEISVVLYLAYVHYTHADELQAVTMLFPLLLSAVGVTYYLSDKRERHELEKALKIKCATDFLQFPILGPVFLAFRVMTIPCGCSHYGNYERIEALALKMRQAAGFFCAAPEAVILLNIFLIDKIDLKSVNMYIEMAAVIMFTITIAESNSYNLMSDYYKLFTPSEPNEWRLENVQLWQKVILFCHTVFSIGSRIVSAATVRAAVQYYLQKSFGFILVITVSAEIAYRLVLFYVCRMVKYCVLRKQIPDGCYESIDYSWKATILNFGFQSENIAVQFAFYFENVACFITWWLSVQYFAEAWIDELLFVPLTVVFISLTGLSFICLLLCNFFRLIVMRGPFFDDTPPDPEELEANFYDH